MWQKKKRRENREKKQQNKVNYIVQAMKPIFTLTMFECKHFKKIEK